MANSKTRKADKKKKYKDVDSKTRLDKRAKSGRPTWVNIPASMSVFSFENTGNYSLDLMPYISAGKLADPVADKGMRHWECTVFTHPRLGPNEKTFTCNAKTFGKSCKACSQYAKLKAKGADDETIAVYKAKQRQLFYIINRKDRDKGVQFFEQAGQMPGDKAFGQMLDAKLEAAADDPESSFHDFWKPECGLTLQVTVKKMTFPKGTFNGASNIELVPRKVQYEDDVWEDLPPLDSLIVPADQDELQKAILGGDDSDDDEDTDEEGEEEEETPKKKKSKSKDKDEDDEEGDEEDDDEDGEEDDEESDDESEEDTITMGDTVSFKYKGKTRVGEITKIKKRKDQVDLLTIEVDGKPYTIDSDDPTLKHVKKADGDEDDVDEDDSEFEEEEEKPKKKDKKSKKKKDEDEDDEEDGDDEDGDEDESDEGDEDSDDEESEDSEDEEDEEDDSEDDEEEVKPKKKAKGKASSKSGKKSSKKSKSEDEEEEEEEEEEDEDEEWGDEEDEDDE